MTIAVAPSSNSDAGTYTMTLEMLINSLPTTAPKESTFTVTITTSAETTTTTAATTTTTSTTDTPTNEPPVFQSVPLELEVFQLVFKTAESQSWSYELPGTEDPDGDDIQTTVNVNTATFVAF